MPDNLTPTDVIRESFLSYFEERGHRRVPSSSLIPQDPTVLFTMAGMMQFKPYFIGLETPPFSRATSSQKCVRAGGKHNDLDDIGRTNRHFSFFEMIGNFSFGDYFKDEAIAFAWDFTLNYLGFEKDNIWITIHESDDDAEKIWQKVAGLPHERIQRLDKDNFWQMGDVGPSGPSSELFYDLGEGLGEDGGPKYGGENRFVEFWNLVFMQYEDLPDGSRINLPKPSVDTGAGLERILFLQEGKKDIWDTSLFVPLIETAQEITSSKYGKDYETDVSLRIMAEHARTMAFLISDGCVPSNEERGYVLRRIIRRAVRHAYMLGAHDVVMDKMVSHSISIMEHAYPELRENASRILTLVKNEEEGFRETLIRGLNKLDTILDQGDVSGQEAFFLHDTLGFPIDLTREIAEQAGKQVDMEGFSLALAEQSIRSRQAQKETKVARTGSSEVYKRIFDSYGETNFIGRDIYETSDAQVLAILDSNGFAIDQASSGQIFIVLDKTPFYAEAGGQVGDTGTISLSDLSIHVHDTQYGIPGTIIVHEATIESGTLHTGDKVNTTIDSERRNRIKRNHTATHILHWALREVLGDHVKQAGSLVDDQRLRFDFQHFEQVTPQQIKEIERLANNEILNDPDTSHDEMSIEQAQKMGAVAFFGDKYGDRVRVLIAGPSKEFCGGTHVQRLGSIGSIRIISEGSIGSNIRRIEAITGDRVIESFQNDRDILQQLSSDVKTSVDEIHDRIITLQSEVKNLTKEKKALKSAQLSYVAREYAQSAQSSVVVFRRDGLNPDELRVLCSFIRDIMGTVAVGAVGINEEGTKAGICVVISKDIIEQGIQAFEIASDAVAILGGGTAKNAEIVVGGGQNTNAVDEALELLRVALHSAVSAL